FKTFPLDQAAEAHRLIDSSKHIGNIVLTIYPRSENMLRSIFPVLVVPFAGCFSVAPAHAQPAPTATTVRAVLVSARLPSVVDAPRHFVVRRVTVPSAQIKTYVNNAIGVALVLAGSPEVMTGSDRRSLKTGEGALISPGITTLKAAGSEQAVLLHFAFVSAN